MLNLLGLDVSLVLDVALSGLLLAIVALGVMRLVRDRFRGNPYDDNEIVERLIEVAAGFVAEAIRAIRSVVADSEPSIQEVERALKTAYRALPEIVHVTISGRRVPVPFKLIVSEQLFVDVGLIFYGGYDQIHDLLVDELTDEYESWKSIANPKHQAS
jgi:hypothetical protein